jgi:hypothetical protein
MRDQKSSMPMSWQTLFASVLALTLLLVGTGCNKKADAAKKAAEADTAVVLPDPPELDSLENLDDAFAEDDFAAEAEATPKAKAATPKGTKAPTAPASPDKGLAKNGAYTLQVGIFNNQKAAQKRVDALIAQGFPAYSAHVRDPKPNMPGDYFRVRIGSFATSAAAREYGATNLAPAGIEFWADLKGRDTQVVSPAPSAPKAAPVAPTPKATPTPAPAPTPPVTPPAPEPTAPAPAPEPPPAPAGDTPPAPKLPDW